MEKLTPKRKRLMPALKVDECTHAALLHAMESTGDTLSNLMNQMLILGLKAYGLHPSRFKPDPRTPTDVEKLLSRKNRLASLSRNRGRFQGFFVDMELQEMVRLYQGRRKSGDVMVEALRLWLKSQGPFVPEPPKERSKPVRRPRYAMLLSENPPDIMAEVHALRNGIPLSTLKHSEDFA